MNNIDITAARIEEGPEVAKLHKDYIGSGFLSSLGTKLLGLLYGTIIKSDAAFCIVAKDMGEVVGFVSGTEKMSSIYMGFIRDNFITACMVLLPKCFRPGYIGKILESLLYPVKSDKDLPDAELLSIVVRDDYQGRG